MSRNAYVDGPVRVPPTAGYAMHVESLDCPRTPGRESPPRAYVYSPVQLRTLTPRRELFLDARPLMAVSARLSVLAKHAAPFW